jgi:predicted RNase H-like HicB family nuclease
MAPRQSGWEPPAIQTSGETGTRDSSGSSLEGRRARNVEKHHDAGWTYTMKYAVIYEKTHTGYSSYAPDLPGCIAAGDTLAETQKLMEGAVELHLAGMREDGETIPEPTTAAEYIDAG